MRVTDCLPPPSFSQQYFLNTTLWFLETDHAQARESARENDCCVTADSCTEPAEVQTSYDPSSHHCCAQFCIPAPNIAWTLCPDILALLSILTCLFSLWDCIYCFHNGSFKWLACALFAALSPAVNCSLYIWLFSHFFSAPSPHPAPLLLHIHCIFATLAHNASLFKNSSTLFISLHAEIFVSCLRDCGLSLLI